MDFGDTLRALIEERDVTQKKLATQLNIAPSTLGSYVQNTREPDFTTLKLLAQYFGVSTDYLLDNQTGHTANHQEDEMLRVFRALDTEQRAICIEHGKIFLRLNRNRENLQG